MGTHPDRAPLRIPGVDIGSGTARRRSAAAALVLGPAGVGLGLGAHVASGGAAPPIAVIVALTALVSLLGASAARLPLPPWALGVGSGVLQQALHLVLSALAGANAPLFPSAAHVHDHAAPLPTIPGGETASAPQDLHLMVVVHIAAALLTALLLAHALQAAERNPIPSASEIPRARKWAAPAHDFPAAPSLPQPLAGPVAIAARLRARRIPQVRALHVCA